VCAFAASGAHVRAKTVMATLDIYSHVVVRTKDYKQEPLDFPKAQCMVDSGFLVITTFDGFNHVFNLNQVDCWLKKPIEYADRDATA
jgi:hypothetical protein